MTWTGLKRRMMGTAPRMQRERVDPAALREYLVDALLIAGTLGIVTFMCCAFTITYEINTMRIAQTQGINDLQRGLFTRLDTALWKCDTLLITLGATSQSITNGLNNVRVQVKQSRDAQTRDTKEISRVATRVAAESLKATESVVAAVVDKSAPVVEIKPSTPTVEVKTAAPIVQPKKEEHPQPEMPVDVPPVPKKRHWFRLWLF